MKKNSILMFTFLIVLAFDCQMASAQFPIKIPKLPKTPKIETSKPTSTPQQQPVTANRNGVEQSSSMEEPKPSGKPLFRKDTLEIQIKTDNKYWKFPDQDYTSWLPKVSFLIFYDESEKLRYTADWTNADGSPWFSESLDDRGGWMESPYSSELFQTKATAAVGTHGLKITNKKTGEIIFQGKFKVAKLPLFPGDARLKNRMQFFADHDWSLPIGYAGLDRGGFGASFSYPAVYMWFKGNLDSKDFEARLFYGNQLITSTDDGGYSNVTQKRGDDNCFEFVQTCKYGLWRFAWKNFVMLAKGGSRDNFPKETTFTEDKPGEYTVKIFYKGAQVREAKFTVDQKGGIASNAFSGEIYPTLRMIPVKVMGTLDKWNAASWKTDAFYGNPVAGFNVP